MSRRRAKLATVAIQGVELIDQVIERVKADPTAISGFCGDHPLAAPTSMPAEQLASLTFPSGKPLPPGLRRWLAFDTSWLAEFGWFDASGNFTPRRLDQIVTDEFEELWGQMFEPIGAKADECFLLPGGSDSRRIYAVTDPDSLGEYPVLVIDTDDLPYVAVMYPGFDVFMPTKPAWMAWAATSRRMRDYLMIRALRNACANTLAISSMGAPASR